MTQVGNEKWNITKIEPNWYHGYMNSPDIYVEVDVDLHDTLDWIYTPVPSDAREKVMLLSTNNAPLVKFVYIADPNGTPNSHGALGGNYQLTDGSLLRSRTGWSSREGVINRDYREYMNDELAGITIRYSKYSLMAGYYIYQDYLRNHSCWPSDLHLVRELKFEEEPYWHISTDPDKVVKAPE